jgi:hypothetical protein
MTAWFEGNQNFLNMYLLQKVKFQGLKPQKLLFISNPSLKAEVF